MSDLRVELLYTADCPHWESVRARLHAILSEGAIETPIQLVLVSSADDAEFLGFVGSPTVRLNGVDVVEPPAGSPTGVGCRLYPQPDGTRSGLIPEDLLRDAVQAHRRGRLVAFQQQEAAKVAAAAIEAAAREGADASRNGAHPGRETDGGPGSRPGRGSDAG